MGVLPRKALASCGTQAAITRNKIILLLLKSLAKKIHPTKVGMSILQIDI